MASAAARSPRRSCVAAGPSSAVTGTATGARGPVAALRTYWSDVDRGDYAQATNMESASERQTDPESNMQAEAPTINVVSAGQASADSGQADVPISFWARDTKTTSFSDTQCRHYTMTAVMVEKSDGSWSYDGLVSGSAVVTVENGNPNCHS